MIILSLLYFEWRYLHKSKKGRIWKRLLLWIPCVAMLTATLIFSLQEHFAPRNTTALFTYLAAEGFFVVPMFAYVLCSAAGHGLRRLFKWRRHYGNIMGLLAVVALWTVVTIGITSGFTTLKVRHITYESADIPEAFNGYRIVQFTDLHVGSYIPSRHYIVRNVVDSILSRHADLVVFTGDLINIHPDELYPHLAQLSRIKAPDGVISVNGNHDYADYLDFDDVQKTAINREIVRLERGMAWKVLQNDTAVIRRGSDHIVIAGTENIYRGSNERCISRGDVAKTMAGIGPDDFTIMLQHTPKSWRTDILPQCHAQLTLSGDTHGMQLGFFGWSPMALVNSEWGGVIHEGDRAINVSTGIGGFVPFRFGMDPEIVVITLKKK